jgi:putative transposase
MTNYRRTYVPGATWFFTVNLAERRSRLLVDRVDELRQALRYVRTALDYKYPRCINVKAVMSAQA